MIRAFVSKILRVNVHMLHGKSLPALDFQQQLLARDFKLYVRANMDCAQANTSSMLGIIHNSRTRITGNRAMVPEDGLL